MPMPVPPLWNNRNNRNYPVAMGTENHVYIGSQGHQGSMGCNMGVQGHDGKFVPVVCTDCGRDNLGTLTTSPDNQPRCIKCHDKFMMVHDIPKCGGCGEPTPFGHKVENVIHCDTCYHNLLAKQMTDKFGALTDNDVEPAWDDFADFTSMKPPENDALTGYDIARDIYITRSQKRRDERQKKKLNKEPKDVGPTHMTPDRMKVLQELQEHNRRPQPSDQMNTPQRLSAAQRRLLENTKKPYVTQEQFENRRERVRKMDFNDELAPVKASKNRKPMSDTKVGGWFSKLVTEIKDGWAELMEEKEEVIEVEEKIEEKVEATSEDKKVESTSEEKVETPSEESKEESKEEPKNEES